MKQIRKNSFIWILAAVFILVSCSKKEEQENNVPQVIPVKVSKVELRDLANIIEYVGNIKAENEVAIYPKVSGKIIEKVKEDGARVDKGDVIAYIDRDEVGLKFEKAPVESTLSGIVGRVYIDIGTNVNTQTAIALVVSMDKVKIEVEIPEKYLSKISLGQSANVTVDAYPEEQFIGKITKISPVVDLATRASPIEITVDNPQHKLQSGMFARVKLILQEHKKSPVILKEAIVGKIPDVYVYTIENKKAQLKKITLGIRQGPYYEVQEGLKEGDLVVIMGQQRLRDGAQVITEE
ncbi:MAG: efflux RND transporter periplasmic adaptor subunit [Candidatus Omnitrophota bacterium]|nr:efflux RND transporter periplasmic adaptor subunit [Candidatus Omnitrophota bacterium]